MQEPSLEPQQATVNRGATSKQRAHPRGETRGAAELGAVASQQRPQLSPRGLQRKSLLPRSLQAQLPNRLAALPFLSWEPESAPSSYTETTFPELTSTACVPCPQNGSKVGPRYLCDIKCPSIHFPVEINSGPDYHHLLTLCVCV